MFETETVRPCLVQKLKWGDDDPLAPPEVTPLVFRLLTHFQCCYGAVNKFGNYHTFTCSTIALLEHSVSRHGALSQRC